jgi:polyisoprenoid-binding protein YceI
MTSVKFPSSLVFPVVALLGTAASAGWTRQGEGTASFVARGPAGLKIVGSTKSLEVADDGKALTVSIKLPELDTDNSLRNRHMLEDLEAAQFPLASLTVPDEAVKEGAELVGKGTFTLHGKSKEVPFKYSSRCAAGVCDVEATLDLSLKDFEIKVRSYLGITVKDEVSVSTKFQMKK